MFRLFFFLGQVFYTQRQDKSLSDILEGTVFSGKTSFMLTGRAFQLLTDIFLFYDFSVDSFLQGYKVILYIYYYSWSKLKNEY